MIAAGAADLGIDAPPEDFEMLANVVSALGDGLAMQRLMTPDAIPDSLFGDILSVLFRALAQEAARTASEEKRS